MEERGFTPHVRSRGEEKLEKMADGEKLADTHVRSPELPDIEMLHVAWK
jgi:hypothetical protein